MLASSLFYGVLAAVATAVTAQTTAQTTAGPRTTTSTSTMTKTITITTCNPSVSNCPGRNTSSTAIVPTIAQTANLTSAMPTPSKNATGYVQPTLSPKTTTKLTVPSSGFPKPPVATVPPTGAGSSVLVQSGLMLGVLGAGIAILA